MGCRENLLTTIDAIKNRFSENIEDLALVNEAATRLLVIDEILGALGWDRTEFNPEHKTHTGQFIDYLLTVDGYGKCIVEAKRVGKTFFHSKRLNRTSYTISFLMSTMGIAFKEVLNQAKSYSKDTGVPYAVITNGDEWVLLDFNVAPGGKFGDGRCFYFGKLITGQCDLNLICDLLSKENVIEGVMEEEFSDINPHTADYSFSPSSSLGELKLKQRESDCINDYYDRFFSEIVDPGRRGMLTHCYVTNAKLEQYEGALKRALSDNAPAFIDNAEDITPADHERLLFGRTGDQKGRVVIVAGSVGVGKTTFIVKSTIEYRESSQFYFLYLDLINEGDMTGNFAQEFLWDEVCNSWRDVAFAYTSLDEMRKIFKNDIRMLKSGPKSDLFKVDEGEYTRAEADLLSSKLDNSCCFVTESWRYVKRDEKKSVILILDNVDRASEGFQKEVYAFSHKVADKTGATVIVTMRESTYFRAKSLGFLDVRSNDVVFHLQAPNLTQLISKRVKYIEENLDHDYRLKEWKKDPAWERFYNFSCDATSMIKRSLLESPEHNKVIQILGAVAWHNVRRFFEIFPVLHKFIGTSAEYWNKRDVYSVLLTRKENDAGTQIYGRLFSPVQNKQWNYFLKLRILLLLIHGVHDGEKRKGIKYSRIVRFSRGYGYPKRWVSGAMEELVRGRMIECLERPAEEDYTANYSLSDKHTFRASPIAHIVASEISLIRVYLTINGWDLPFYDPGLVMRFIKEANGTCADFVNLDVEDLGYMQESKMASIVAQYLLDAHRMESMAISVSNNHEADRVEEKLKEFVNALDGVFGREFISPRKRQSEPLIDSVGVQKTLFEDEPSVLDMEPLIKIPENVASARLSNSLSLPRILWALVHLRSIGSPPVTGAQLTHVINRHLLDDYSKVEATNISRALRSPVMKKQNWITRKPGNIAGTTVFELGDDWQSAWTSVFDVKPPDV